VSSVLELEELVARLPADAREAARRIFSVSATTGTLVAPPEMEPWIATLFGSLEAVRSQRIVRVTNLVTLEGALFNELRSRRPMEVKGADDVRKAIAESANDPFCRVETGTPADPFGRVVGRHGTSVSNVAKYDGFHGVLVFKEHDPLAPLPADVLADHFATARAWARKGLEADPAARYYFLMWNSLWRAGGSIVHGHMQMTLTRGMHYPKVEALRRQALAYASEHGRDYFDDLWGVHEALGLGAVAGGARIMAYLAPVKERELLIVGRPGQDESALVPAVARGLAALRGLGTVAHNLAVYVAPLTPDGSDWSRLPPVARIVDRGDPANRTSDIGAMELYASSVVASDPFRVADAFSA
jgi:hypothetical protein